ARADQHAAQVVLFDRALELTEMLVTATRDRDRERDEAALVLIAQRSEVAVRLAGGRQRFLAGVALEVMARVRDHAHVEAAFVMQPQHVIDGRGTLPAPERCGLLARRMDVGVPVDDHGCLPTASQLSSPRKRGSMLRVLSIVLGVWVPAFAGTTPRVL